MADNKKETKSPISAAPVVINTAVAPAVANRDAVKLKAPTETRLKREDPIVAPIPADAPKSEEDVAFQRFIRMELINYGQELTTLSLDDWVKDNTADLGKDFDPKDPIDRSYADFQRNNSSDRRTTSDYESSAYSPFMYNPRVGGSAGRSNSPYSIIDDGFKAPAFKLSKNEARTALAADIRTVSDMYAKEAGMSSKDFAKVMGGIATIESSFGTIRSVSGTKYASSAGGAFHYLDGTIAGEVRQNMADPRIANRVASLGVSVKDGVSKSEAWALKEDNILAGSILATRIVEAVQKNPELRNDPEALAKRVYQSHNLGDAGAQALARGGRSELDRLSVKSAENNPLFFRGAKDDAEIDARYTKFVGNAMKSSESFITAAFSGATPDVQVAQATTKQQPGSKFAAAAPSREPA